MCACAVEGCAGAGRPGHGHAGRINPGEDLPARRQRHGRKGVGGDGYAVAGLHPALVARFGLEGVLGIGLQPGKDASHSGDVLLVKVGSAYAAQGVHFASGRGHAHAVARG